MRQLLLIDPIEKLNIRKDSTLMFALCLQRRGIETFVFFEDDFAIHNQGLRSLLSMPLKALSKKMVFI